MSYYRESVRDEYDDYDRPITIKRYVVGSDDRDDRRDDRRDELVIRRRTDREEPLEIQRYKREVDYYPLPVVMMMITNSLESLDMRSHCHDERREYRAHHGGYPSRREQLVMVPKARYVNSRESDYEMVRRSDAEDDVYYRRRRYDDRRSRRDISPDDSISQTSRRRRSDRDREDYSSDDSMVYIRKETRDYDDEHPHHRRHLAEGALVGMGAAELVRSRSKRNGKEVSHGVSHAAKTAGAGALGAVAVNAASHIRDYYRSKSRSRHRSRGRHSRSRSRSRSHSHSRAKTLLELGVGAAAVAAGVAALRNNNKDKEERRSRSRSRSKSRGRGLSTTRSEKGDDRSLSRRRKHMIEAGAAGAALGGIAQYARSRSRSGKHKRSQSRLRQALPVVVAGLGTAAATGLYEKKKAEKQEKEGKSRERRRSRSHSRGAPIDGSYPDPTRDSAGLIEYGNGGVAGSIPADHYYGQPPSPGAPYYSDGPRSSRSPPTNLIGKDAIDTVIRVIAMTGHAMMGLIRMGTFTTQGNTPRHPSSTPAGRQLLPQYQQFPPATSLYDQFERAPRPIQPGRLPSTPGAAPPSQPYNYGAPGQGTETYAPRPRHADENVRSNPKAQAQGRATLGIPNEEPSTPDSKAKLSKSVAFALEPPQDSGYETDDSDSSLDSQRKPSDRSSGHRGPLSSSHPHQSSQFASNSHPHDPNRRPQSPGSSDSESTIDLPDRFDKNGRPLSRNPDLSEILNEDPLLRKLTRLLF
ncbi:hypothetical protein N7468_005665 [Penicillium chermesinum]|uniref:DUF3824 domain-containing protein n=1 Tax=Penicillium chermesinum TaxID=63820 RepID=A0A9W9NZQ7_9EURO|nr:uncharacterized protein N7468_005665 [Penicillium chermesinum]KAJ5232709.1 hypothetical protein N7468_005665 [Penicillium chermesinum]